jgi:hypothetical protein
MDFHLWYLRAKGWIGREENGTLSITVDGIDQINSQAQAGILKQLTNQSIP